jgi:hypothetical protein
MTMGRVTIDAEGAQGNVRDALAVAAGPVSDEEPPR